MQLELDFAILVHHYNAGLYMISLQRSVQPVFCGSWYLLCIHGAEIEHNFSAMSDRKLNAGLC